MAETGKLLYEESKEHFKKRERGMVFILILVSLLFLNFALQSIFRSFEEETYQFFSSLPLLIFIFTIPPLYLKNRRKVLIYENCFQPGHIPFFNIRSYKEFLIPYSQILVVKSNIYKGISFLTIYTKDKKKSQIWDIEEIAKEILMKKFNENRIRIMTSIK